FAIRDWARRSPAVRATLQDGDAARLTALTDMFARHGYPDRNAVARARVLYYMQLGYDDSDIGEMLEERLAMVPDYLIAFTGQTPEPHEIEAFSTYARAL
ncbi:MAG: TetR/AcrR family transcriptional regulator, partial [Pseudomonadota bacterium]